MPRCIRCNTIMWKKNFSRFGAICLKCWGIVLCREEVQVAVTEAIKDKNGEIR